MTTKLALFNDALLILGERKLASLSEAREPRRALDDAYDTTLAYCLEQGFWNFAMRAVQIGASASVTPAFGYTYAFTKPTDFIRLHSASANAELTPPLVGREMVDEPNYWFANCDPLYVKYVSDDTAYGRDLSLWPETFANYVAIRLAFKTCKKITGSYPDADMRAEMKRARMDALSKDAMNEPVGIPPKGSWITSRGASTSTRRDSATS